MKIRNISYPYPVLGNADDVKGSFVAQFFHRLGRDKTTFRIKFKVENDTIQDLVKSGKAAFFVEIECNSTFFRETYSTNKFEDSFQVASSKVRNQVLVKFYVRATEDIAGLSIKNCHPDYKGFEFEITKGDVLAIAGSTTFFADKEFDPLKPSVRSFMQIKKGQHPSGPMDVDYEDSEKIIIRLSEADWYRYKDLKNRNWIVPVLHVAIVLPALAGALELIKQGDQDAKDNHWYQRLEVIMVQNKYPADMPLYAAQQILKNPLSRSLEAIESVDEDNDE